MNPASIARDADSAAPPASPQALSHFAPHARSATRYTGRIFVTLQELRRKLGCSALQVWQALLLLRSADNTIHATRAGLGHLRGFAELPDSVVKDALSRLRTACLIQDIGWRVLRVPERGRWVEREVFLRRVYGARGQSSGSPVVEGAYVPREAAAALRTMAGWGGARPGAGRKPRGCSLRLPPTGGAEVPQVLNIQADAESFQEGPRAIQEPPIRPPGADSSTPTDRTLLPSLERSESVPTERTPAREGARPHSLEEGRAGRAPAELPGLPWEAILRVAGRGVVPPFPGQEVVAPAVVPDPPRLRPGLSERAAAMVLVRAYRGAIESRYGRGGTYRLPPELKMVEANLPLLTSAAALLAAEEIAPAAWAAWSVDIWRDYVASRSKNENPPRLPFVFGAKRLEDPQVRGWFGKEGAALGGRVIFTPEHRALVLRWQRMRFDVMRRGAITPEELSAVASRWWPPGAYDAAVRRARETASREERALRDRVERGEFLW